MALYRRAWGSPFPLKTKPTIPRHLPSTKRRDFKTSSSYAQEKTWTKEAVAFTALAASTPKPSASLIMEARALTMEPFLPDAAAMNLAEGAVSLAIRPDAPLYARRDALRLIVEAYSHVTDAAKGQEQDIRIAVRMLDAFHNWVVDPKRDVYYPEEILTSLACIWLDRSYARSSALVKERLARLPKDLAAYEKRLEAAGGAGGATRVRDLGAEGAQGSLYEDH